MVLYTSRLNIRELFSGDINNIHILHSIPETDKFNTLGLPGTMQITEKLVTGWLKERDIIPRASYILCIDLRDPELFIGLIGLNLRESKFRSGEVWFKIHPNYWGNKYATEALNEILAFGFNELSLYRIEAGCAVGNIASIRVLEKSGMTREGTKRKILPIRGKWVDAYGYAILKEDFNIKSKEKRIYKG